MTGIIYTATNQETGEVYVGETTGSLEKRKRGHWKSVKRGSKYHFHNALRLYGPEAFRWRVIRHIEAPTAELLASRLRIAEQIYVVLFDSYHNGYNSTTGGDNGYVFSPETRQKMREANKGQVPWIKGEHHTEETKQKISKKAKGRVKSPETRRKIGEAGRGRPCSEETRRKRSKALKGRPSPMKGRHHTEMTKQKMSETHKSKPPTEAHIRALVAANKRRTGEHHTEETKQKMREAQKDRPPCSEETRRKISEANTGERHPMFGKHHTEESKRKMSKAHKGKPSPNKGKTASPETREKLRKAHMGQVPVNKGKKGLQVCTDEARDKMRGREPWNKGKKGPPPPNKGKHKQIDKNSRISYV